MKNTFFLAIVALFIGISASAQSTVDSIAAKYQLLPMPAPLTIEKSFPVLGTYQLTTTAPVSSTTVTTNATTGTTNSTSTAVEGSTTSATASTVEGATPGITITLDSASKGIVWVDGLPEGRFKAYLKKSPTTYRIITQKTNLGKQIPEGTLIYDEATNTLNISLGKAYNEEDPAGIFATNTMSASTTDASVSTTTKSKTKSKSGKVTFYTATKTIVDPTQVQNSTSAIQNQQ